MAKIVIVQPYVPAYRAPLFEALGRRLREQGDELVIVSGEPAGDQAARSDSVSLPTVEQTSISSRSIRLGPLRVRLSSARGAWKDADAIIVELAAGSTATYEALLQRRRPVGVWGHVDSFVTPDTRATHDLRRWQARHADHVLAYTERGAATARRWGIPRETVTVLGNTVDTVDLRAGVLLQRLRDQQEVFAELGVPAAPTFAMIGGLDESKRVDLVVAALDHLWEKDSSIQLLVGGRGSQEHMFRRGERRGQVHMLGYVEDDTKARISRVSLALVNPGRVGLIAVESKALGLPVITTNAARHGPEFEYLRAGVDTVLTAGSASALAGSMLEIANDPAYAGRLATAADAQADSHPLQGMVDAMTAVVNSLLSTVPARPGHPRM